MAEIEGIKTVLLSDEDRTEMMNSHPIVEREYTVVTPMIETAYGIIRNRVWTRRTGSVLFAKPRTGKTSCAEAVNLSLAAEFNNIHITFLSADQRHSPVATGIILDIMQADGLMPKASIKYKAALPQLITHIVTSLAALGGNQYVLIIDEMQLLTEPDLAVLLVLHNRLRQRKISMTTLGFAQPEILNLQATLALTHAFNLIARFLSEPILFDGCCCVKDLKTILSAYDLELRYPANSDWTYTRFFLPSAFAAGFRLSDHAQSIFDALVVAAKSLGTDSIPMEHITRTVEYLLLATRSADATSFTLDDSTYIQEAVKESNLKYFADLMRTSENAARNSTLLESSGPHSL